MSYITTQPDQQIIGDGETEIIGEVSGLGSVADTLVGLFWADKAGDLTIEYSGDGTNWDYIETIAVTASTGVKVSSTIIAPYVRVRFKNTTGTDTAVVRGKLRTASAGPR